MLIMFSDAIGPKSLVSGDAAMLGNGTHVIHARLMPIGAQSRFVTKGFNRAANACGHHTRYHMKSDGSAVALW